MSATRTTLALLMVLGAGCAHAHRKAEEPEILYQREAQKKSSTLITSEELQDPSITTRDALTAIRHLRPSFFTYHGPTSIVGGTAGDTQLSFDYGPLQRVDNLKRMNTWGMKGVRYLNAEEAQARFGLNANGGAVIVVLYNAEP